VLKDVQQGYSAQWCVTPWASVFSVRCLGAEHPDRAWSIGSGNKLSRSCTQSRFTRCLTSYDGGSLYTGVIVEHRGVTGCKAKGSRVHTRITDTGSGRNNSAELILYGEPSRGCNGDRGRVSIQMQIQGRMPGHRVGIDSPSVFTANDPRQQSVFVRGPSGRSGCLRDSKMTLKCWRGHRCGFGVLSGLGVRRTGPIAFVAVGLVSISLGVLRNITGSRDQYVEFNSAKSDWDWSEFPQGCYGT